MPLNAKREIVNIITKMCSVTFYKQFVTDKFVSDVPNPFLGFSDFSKVNFRIFP